MLLSHHSAFRIGVHGWSGYELREKGDIRVGHSHSHAVRRSVGTVRRTNHDGYGTNVMHGSRSKAFDLRCGASRVPTAMDNGITNALVGGIGQDRIGVHQPAQFKDEEHSHENHDDHQSGLNKSLTALTSPPTLLPRSHRSSTETSWRPADEIAGWTAG